MREARDTRGTAKCADCIFGRLVTLVDKPRKTKTNPDPADIVREMCERTFAGLGPQSMSII